MLLEGYPTISQTYMLTEIKALQNDYDLRIVSLGSANLPSKNHLPYSLTKNPNRIQGIIDEFRPDVLHGHFLRPLPLIAKAAEKAGLPYTIRAHSFDALPFQNGRPFPWPVNRMGKTAWAVNSENCLGILTFPFTRPWLEKRGFRKDKLIDCWPVIDYKRFYDRSPNGDAVMNAGACLPAKKMENFIDLAQIVKKPFNLYALGYEIEIIQKYNDTVKSPINICDPIEPNEMLGVYKKHGWLVFTACPQMMEMGWPVGIAEAQAAGLGVCIPNFRPDIKTYLGGAGFVYDSIRDLPEILNRPYPDDMREIGFEQAKKSDIEGHKKLLTDLWDRAAERPGKISQFINFTTYDKITEPFRAIAGILANKVGK